MNQLLMVIDVLHFRLREMTNDVCIL